jgi:putative nucleotidyltransferase with HDIG domain
MAVTEISEQAALALAPVVRVPDGTPSVLVVDDEEAVAMVLARGLGRAGYRTEVARSGAEALERLALRRFDVLLSDIRMPRMRGDELQSIARERDPELVVLLITAELEVTVAVECLKQGVSDYLTKPFDLSDVVNRVGKALERRERSREERTRRNELERCVAAQQEQLDRTLNGSVLALVQTLQAKDEVTYRHSARVSELAATLALRVLPGDGSFAARVRIAGQLHDIGKIGVPDGILTKEGALSNEEMRRIREHPVTGANILRSLLDAEIVAMVRGHHEQVCGGGYPDGLAGEAIPFGARIIAVADAYDALTSERPYKPEITHADVLDILRRGANQHWDEDVVEAMMAMDAEGELKDIVPPTAGVQEALSLVRDLGDIRSVYPSVRSAPRQAVSTKDPLSGCDPGPVIYAKGPIEGNTLRAIQAAFEARLDRGLPEIVLDIQRCDRITPQSAQRLCEMDQQARLTGRRLVIRNASREVREVFERAGLARTLRFEHSGKV